MYEECDGQSPADVFRNRTFGQAGFSELHVPLPLPSPRWSPTALTLVKDPPDFRDSLGGFCAVGAVWGTRARQAPACRDRKARTGQAQLMHVLYIR
jgi:hypothetical protein